MILQKQILELLDNLRCKLGFAVIMTSHDIRVVRAFCQNIVVMQNGRIDELLTTQQLEEGKYGALTQKLLESELHLA